MLFDSHAHYDDEKFSADREELISSLPYKKISNFVNIGSDLESSIKSVQFAKKYDFIYAAVGIHPHAAEEYSPDAADKIISLCENEKVVAIGEIGLDYYYPEPERTLQKEVFSAQLEIAKKLSLPVVIHDRDAHGDCLEILKMSGIEGFGGVMHCFSGSVEMAKTVLSMGMYISLGGPVTYKNARHSVEVAKYVPLDRLLIETDCPYLTPEPHRGKRNDSSYIIHTAEKIAEIKETTLEEVARITAENAKRLFKIN